MRLVFGHPRRAAAAVLVLSLLSMVAWRVEVEWIKGWAGLGWLHGYPWAAVPICVLVAGSILVAVASMAPVRVVSAGAFLAVVTGVGWVSFEIARRWLYVDQEWLLPPARSLALPRWALSPLLSIALSSVGVYLAISRLLFRLRPWTVVLFVAADLLVLPTSWLTLQIIPAHGYRDGIHAIKAGYPMLWTPILTAGAAALAVLLSRRHSDPATSAVRPSDVSPIE
jgi:hypothetical protein